MGLLINTYPDEDGKTRHEIITHQQAINYEMSLFRQKMYYLSGIIISDDDCLDEYRLMHLAEDCYYYGDL